MHQTNGNVYKQNELKQIQISKIKIRIKMILKNTNFIKLNKDKNDLKQFDQSLRCLHEETLHPWLSTCAK